ncbi:acetaldehyde dehydrogenase (acetylating) [Ralstonia pickettii]|nr:acetaldehyde dehydrogenase (acetylating) [Ralstonia pickettii]
MMEMDKDLQSIHEARTLIGQAKEAQRQLAKLGQEDIDHIVKAMAEAAYEHRERLAKLAVEDTGFGIVKDKVLKNLFASYGVYRAIKDMKTVGIINEDEQEKIVEVAVPVGVIAALVPSTNPTSTVMNKALIAIKAGNAVVFSPHPSALNCILETTRILAEAAEAAGCPKGAITSMTKPTMQGTDTLMKHRDVSLILATGGSAMVKAAYSSGTPAIGVGPGNGPAFIERSANVKQAVKRIIDSKTFDNGVICASEQSVIVEADHKEVVVEEFKRQHAYFLSKEEAAKLEKFIMRPNGTMNPQIVGKSALFLADLAGISVPSNTRVLIAEEDKVGKDVPFSREKLSPILAFYIEKDWRAALDRSIEILLNEGAGHTMTVHSEKEEIIRAFTLEVPVFRLLVNTSATLGAIGATTNLLPAYTLGCGALGNGSTSDNVGPMNLLNIKRVAIGIKDLAEIESESNNTKLSSAELNEDMVERVVEQVLRQLYVMS